jgi:BirA family biotin operon repressor/biotin-[acetyl-CoA-carboxylase] ligase
MSISVIHFKSVESTQRHANLEVSSGRLTPAHGPTIYIAEEQRGGVGRFDRAWLSPRGGLWCTFAAPIPEDARAFMEGLGLRIGVACAEFVESLLPEGSPSKVRLKWPNDVLIDGRKVLGVLTTMVQSPGGPWVLIGVGLNANFPADELPAEMRGHATTLASSTGMVVDLTAAAGRLAERLAEAATPEGVTAELLLRAHALLHGLGEAAMVSLPTGQKLEATLVGIDRFGQAVFDQQGSRWVAPTSATIMLA